MNTYDLFLHLNSKVEKEKILWIQGPGGNTSFKDGPSLLIKASGTRIRDLTSINQLAKLDLQCLLASMENLNNTSNFEESYKNAIELNTAQNSPRPSMESGFHAELPQPFVFHMHSLAAMGLAEYVASQANTAKFYEWFNLKWKNLLGEIQIIDFHLPGYQLTKAIASIASIAKNSPSESPSAISPCIFWLRNHGVVLAFKEEDFLETYRQFEDEALKIFLPQAWDLIKNWKQMDALKLIHQFPELLEAEIDFYFPDMAILWSRIQKYLIKTENNTYYFNLRDNKTVDNSLDMDALENWIAGSMLQKLFPHLPRLPQNVCDQIINLPTEIARKKNMEPHS